MRVSPVTNQAVLGATSSAFADVFTPRVKSAERFQPESPSDDLLRELVVTDPTSIEQAGDAMSGHRRLDMKG